MALTEADWESIYRAIERSQRMHEVTYGKVIRRDDKKKLVWLSEFGDQAIPVVGLRGKITYYDTNAAGTVQRKEATVEPEVPKLGELVVVLRQMGSRRLPKCVGVVLSRSGTYTG